MRLTCGAYFSLSFQIVSFCKHLHPLLPACRTTYSYTTSVVVSLVVICIDNFFDRYRDSGMIGYCFCEGEGSLNSRETINILMIYRVVDIC